MKMNIIDCLNAVNSKYLENIDGIFQEAFDWVNSIASENAHVFDVIDENDENNLQEENNKDSSDPRKNETFTNKIEPPKKAKVKEEKENVLPERFHSRRTAAVNATKQIKNQCALTLNTKLRQPSDFDISKVKAEKISIDNSSIEDVNKENEFVPPAVVPTKTRTKRKRKSNAAISIPKVEEDCSSPKPKTSKRTKKRKNTDNKNIREFSVDLFDDADVEMIQPVHPKVSLSDTETNDTSTVDARLSMVEKSCHELPEKSIYEDASSKLEACINKDATFVITPPNSATESTTASTTTTTVNEDATNIVSPTNNAPLPNAFEPKQLLRAKTKEKILFSPLDPVKKRIEAIEKLTNGANVPSSTRITRTQSKVAMQQERAKSTSRVPGNIATGITSFLTKNTPVKKPTKAELQKQREEDQRKLIAKEDEALLKREALKKAKVEEQRKRREEKLQRAQQQREEKERLRKERIERREKEREEETKRLMAEREEISRKELQRKKAISEKRALETEERRKAEEAARLQRLLEQEEAKKQADNQRKKEQEEAEKLHQRKLQEAEYKNKMKAQVKEKLNSVKKTFSTPTSSFTDSKLRNKPPSKIAPHLHTNKIITDFDSDSDSDCVPKIKAPWKVNSEFVRLQNKLPTSKIRSLFSSTSKPFVINLREVFPRIDMKAVGRNSSAIWKTPPRYSVLNVSNI